MDGKWADGIGVAVVLILVAAILVAITPAPVVADPGVVVDGAINPANEWNNPLLTIVDTTDALGTAIPEGYNISQLKVTVKDNTLYVLFTLVGVAGDVDENGDPNTGPHEYPGIGHGATFGYEEYTLRIDADNNGFDDYWLTYTEDTTFLTLPWESTNLGAVTNGAFGSKYVEMSLANASEWINPDDFCVSGYADTDYGGSEDYTPKKCYFSQGQPPPTPPPAQEVPLLNPLGILILFGILGAISIHRLARKRV
jgi:hypothetical protein